MRILSSIVLLIGFATANGQPARALDSIPTQYLMVKLNVTDLNRSLNFYTNVIGLKESHRYGGTAPNFPLEVMLSETGKDLEAQLVLVDEKPKGAFEIGNGFRNLVCVVPDVRAVVKRVVAAGLPVTMQPNDIKMADIGYASGLTVAFIKDPDGYPIEVVQWNR
jgi:lactoylglutathione lyase